MESDKRSYFETVAGMIALTMFVHSEFLTREEPIRVFQLVFPFFVGAISMLAVKTKSFLSPAALVFAPIIVLLFLVTDRADLYTTAVIITPSLAYPITAVVGALTRLSAMEVRLGVPLQMLLLGFSTLSGQIFFSFGIAVLAGIVFFSLHFVPVKDRPNLKAP